MDLSRIHLAVRVFNPTRSKNLERILMQLVQPSLQRPDKQTNVAVVCTKPNGLKKF